MRTGPAAAVLLLALAGCGGSTPQDALVERVGAVTARANAEDAEGLREAALALQDEVRAQRDAGDLTDRQAARLTALAASVRERADLVDAELQREQADRTAAEQARLQAERAAAE